MEGYAPNTFCGAEYEKGTEMEGLTINDSDKMIHVAFPPDLIEKLDELSKAKYRGVKRQQAIRWIVEDAYKAYEEEVEKK